MTLSDLLEMSVGHSVSKLRGDLEDKGLLGTILGLGSEVLRGSGMNPIKVPAQSVDVGKMIYQNLPEVTPLGSWLNHPAVQQRGGDLLGAVLELAKPRYGNLPKE